MKLRLPKIGCASGDSACDSRTNSRSCIYYVSQQSVAVSGALQRPPIFETAALDGLRKGRTNLMSCAYDPKSAPDWHQGCVVEREFDVKPCGSI